MLNETLIAAFLAAFMPTPVHAADAGTPPAAVVQKKPQVPNRIYGSQLMAAEERDAYRARMKQAKTQSERDDLRQEHHAQMQQRAKDRGVTLPEQPRSRAKAGRSGDGSGAGPKR